MEGYSPGFGKLNYITDVRKKWSETVVYYVVVVQMSYFSQIAASNEMSQRELKLMWYTLMVFPQGAPHQNN
jgi:hypothetical protein